MARKGGRNGEGEGGVGLKTGSTVPSFQTFKHSNIQTFKRRVWGRDGTLVHSLANHDGAIFALKWNPSVRQLGGREEGREGEREGEVGLLACGVCEGYGRGGGGEGGKER